MPARLLLVLSLLAVGLGAGWRWHYLDSRPLHVDEAVQAWQTWQLLRGEGYRYDPVDRHGPWLYYGAAALERVSGGDADSWDDHRARLFVWIAGVLTLLVVALAGHRWLGPWAGLFATALVAAAPLAVLYQTYFVQEAWLALFTWILVFAVVAWHHRPRLALAAVIGASLGMMQVTKETTVLHVAALGVALLVVRPGWPAFPAGERRHGWPRTVGVAAGVAVALYAAFYSGFGTHPQGLVDGIRTYLHQWQRAGEADHTYPFLHYLRLLLPHRSGGVRWGEPALLAFALGGLLLTWRRQASFPVRLVGTFTAVLLLIYSLIPYKTPWLLLTPMIGVALLAGYGLAALQRVHRYGFILALAAAVATVAQLNNRTRLALDRYPGDERNPYFYQQTPRSFTRLVTRLEELSQAADPATGLRVAVISPDYAWPLPWYLRQEPQVGFFLAAPPQAERFDVLIWDTRIDTDSSWPEDAMVELHGLRPNVLLQVAIRPELWQRWEALR